MSGIPREAAAELVEKQVRAYADRRDVPEHVAVHVVILGDALADSLRAYVPKVIRVALGPGKARVVIVRYGKTHAAAEELRALADEIDGAEHSELVPTETTDAVLARERARRCDSCGADVDEPCVAIHSGGSQTGHHAPRRNDTFDLAFYTERRAIRLHRDRRGLVPTSECCTLDDAPCYQRRGHDGLCDFDKPTAAGVEMRF